MVRNLYVASALKTRTPSLRERKGGGGEKKKGGGREGSMSWMATEGVATCICNISSPEWTDRNQAWVFILFKFDHA